MEAEAEECLERSLPGMLSVLSLGEPAVSKGKAMWKGHFKPREEFEQVPRAINDKLGDK